MKMNQKSTRAKMQSMNAFVFTQSFYL